MSDPLPEPPDHELRAFAMSLLGKFGGLFTEEGIVEEAIREQRDLWVMLYRTDRGDIELASPP